MFDAKTAEVAVNAALAAYAADVMNATAGYALMKYAEKGYLKINNEAFAAEFMAWYPRNPAYLILRMAQKGQLEFQPLPTYDDLMDTVVVSLSAKAAKKNLKKTA